MLKNGGELNAELGFWTAVFKQKLNISLKTSMKLGGVRTKKNDGKLTSSAEPEKNDLKFTSESITRLV